MILHDGPQIVILELLIRGPGVYGIGFCKRTVTGHSSGIMWELQNEPVFEGIQNTTAVILVIGTEHLLELCGGE